MVKGYSINLTASRTSIPALTHKLRLVADLVENGHKRGVGWIILECEIAHNARCKCINCLPAGVPVDEGA